MRWRQIILVILTQVKLLSDDCHLLRRGFIGTFNELTVLVSVYSIDDK